MSYEEPVTGNPARGNYDNFLEDEKFPKETPLKNRIK